MDKQHEFGFNEGDELRKAFHRARALGLDEETSQIIDIAYESGFAEYNRVCAEINMLDEFLARQSDKRIINLTSNYRSFLISSREKYSLILNNLAVHSATAR